MSCKYLTTGQLECKEDFAGSEAEIGEECSTKSCSEGVCVAPYGRGRGLYCYNIVDKGETGCEKSFAICAKGAKCKDNLCVKDDNTNQPTEKVIAKDTSMPTAKKEDGVTINIGTSSSTILLYVVLGVIILLCLIALIYHITKT